MAYISADFEGFTQKLLPTEADRFLRAPESKLTLITVEANHTKGDPDDPD